MDDLTGIPEDPQEAALALLHSRAEVARLKEREQLFSALLASVNSVLWAYDWQNRRMVYVSPAYEKIFGRSAALLLADYEEWRNSIYPDDLDYADSSLLQVLERGAVEQREYRIVRGDGEVRWLNDKCFVSRQGEAGLPLMVVGIAEDITDKKHMESEPATAGHHRRADPEQQPSLFLRQCRGGLQGVSPRGDTVGVPAAGRR